jgi:hypothetical protein
MLRGNRGSGFLCAVSISPCVDLSQCINLVGRGLRSAALTALMNSVEAWPYLRIAIDYHLVAFIQHTFWVPHVDSLCPREDYRQGVVVVCGVCGFRSDSSSRSCRVVRINLLVADRLERLGFSVQRVLWRTVDGDGCHDLV